VLSNPLEIRERFEHRVDCIIDGGILVSEPSSVISLVDDSIEIVRVGKGDVSTLI
jgi:tRNA A37 threonylcarbamoyladenosine synthetase subunit TsaC/SUA5/YrdC